jgi:hypothetical protein
LASLLASAIFGHVFGCAAARPESESENPENARPEMPDLPSGDDPSRLDDYIGLQKRYQSELDDALSDPKPRCERRCQLQANICDLAERICTISQKHVEDTPNVDVAAMCQDAQARCDKAKSQVAPTCTCAPQPQ